MNKRQRKKLEKKKLEEQSNEKIIDLSKLKEEKDEVKMNKEVKREGSYKKLTKEQVHYIAELIDKGHGNTYILKELKAKFGIDRKSHSITHIRRGEHPTFKALTDDNYHFAEVGYPTFNEYKKILRGEVKPKSKTRVKTEETVNKVKESPVVEKVSSVTEEKVEQVKEKMSNIQKDKETGKEYRDKESIHKAGKPQETIFDKIIKRVLNIL
ncbi:hypothetical protein PALS2_090 [Staphylococcus phage PALS_2]|nr:hypothetical protein PALS2_090 [Staphylococcus phage PALS_2]